MGNVETATAANFNWYEEFMKQSAVEERDYVFSFSDSIELTSQDICILGVFEDVEDMNEPAVCPNSEITRITSIQTTTYGPGDTVVEKVEELAGEELESLIIEIQELACEHGEYYEQKQKAYCEQKPLSSERKTATGAGEHVKAGYFNSLYRQLVEEVALTPVIRMFYEAEILKSIFAVRKEAGLSVETFRNENGGYGRGKIDVKYVRKEKSDEEGTAVSREYALETVHALKQYDALMATGETENILKARELALKYFPKFEVFV